MRRLKSDAVDLVITTPEAALRLLERSALSVEIDYSAGVGLARELG